VPWFGCPLSSRKKSTISASRTGVEFAGRFDRAHSLETVMCRGKVRSFHGSTKAGRPIITPRTPRAPEVRRSNRLRRRANDGIFGQPSCCSRIPR